MMIGGIEEAFMSGFDILLLSLDFLTLRLFEPVPSDDANDDFDDDLRTSDPSSPNDDPDAHLGTSLGAYSALARTVGRGG